MIGGWIIEQIPFEDGCPCAGGFQPELVVPSRVPPGEHLLVARMLRISPLGGEAEYCWPVQVVNDEFGKPVRDTGWQDLREKFAGRQARFVSLRRAAEPVEALPRLDGEQVVAAPVADAAIHPSNRDWDSSNANFGAERLLRVGLMPWHHAPSRVLLRFDLGGLDRQAKLLAAQLRLMLWADDTKVSGGKLEALEKLTPGQ